MKNNKQKLDSIHTFESTRGKEILEKINKGEIKMKPKWEFVVKSIGVKWLWLMLVLGSAWSILGITFFVELYNPMELAEFGDVGRQVFLEDFPYYWLGGVVLFLILATNLLARLGDNYKKTTKIILLLTGMTALGLTLVMLVANRLLP